MMIDNSLHVCGVHRAGGFSGWLHHPLCECVVACMSVSVNRGTPSPKLEINFLSFQCYRTENPNPPNPELELKKKIHRNMYINDMQNKRTTPKPRPGPPS